MSDLGGRHASQELGRLSQLLNPANVAHEIVEVREGRPFRCSLQRVESTPPELIALQQGVQLPALLLGQSIEDRRKQPPVHDGTHVGHQSIEGAERRC